MENKEQNRTTGGTIKLENSKRTTAAVVTATHDSGGTPTHSNVKDVQKKQESETSDEFPFIGNDGYACTCLQKRRGKVRVLFKKVKESDTKAFLAP